MVGGGIYLALNKGVWALLAAGGGSLVATLVSWPIVLSIQSASAARKLDQHIALGPITDKLLQLSQTLSTMSQQQLLSDRAKAIAYRKQDLAALRSAIKEEMAHSDWEAALA